MALHSRATVLAGLAAAAAAPSVVRAADVPTVRVGGAPTDATAQHLYAQELGMFAATGIKVEISTLRNSGALIAGLIGGDSCEGAGSHSRCDLGVTARGLRGETDHARDRAAGARLLDALHRPREDAGRDVDVALSTRDEHR